jgi:hypothetical protein
MRVTNRFVLPVECGVFFDLEPATKISETR